MRRYDVTARSYDSQYSEEQYAKYSKALENAVIPSGCIVLDAGCGTGLLFSRIAPVAKTVVGMDISRELLLRAKEKASELDNVHLLKADADCLPLRNSCFDLVFAFTMLQNMPRPLETLKAFGQTAKKDATIIVSGLKKHFSMEAFANLLKDADFNMVSIINDDVLKCYVAIVKKIC
jgi:ubiquinone/menaquinone biosynthesis C-methylase UbiE